MIRDLYDRRIVAYKTGNDQTVNLVLDTIHLAMKQVKKKAAAELQLHSDQGAQYASQAYFELTQTYGITPSMSRRGNPYDNAMAENFFSILKTECFNRSKPAIICIRLFFFISLYCIFNTIRRIPTWINIVNRIVRTVRIQVEPIAPVGVLLGKPGYDRVIEPDPQVILLGDRVKLLAGVLEAVGDGLLLSGQVAPRVVLVAVLDIASFINDVGG